MNKDLKKEILEKIKKNDIKVRSKNFFKFIKMLFLVLSIFLGISAIYIFNLSFYLPRRAGVLGVGPTPPVIFDSIPWGLVLIGALIIGVLIYIYKKYEGGYKKNLLWTVIIISLGIVILGGFASATKLNENLEESPHFQRFYEEGQRKFVPGEGRRLNPGKRRMLLPYAPEAPENMKDFN